MVILFKFFKSNPVNPKQKSSPNPNLLKFRVWEVPFDEAPLYAGPCMEFFVEDIWTGLTSAKHADFAE